MIAGIYVPSSGCVLVDGVDLSTVKLNSYRRNRRVVAGNFSFRWNDPET